MIIRDWLNRLFGRLNNGRLNRGKCLNCEGNLPPRRKSLFCEECEPKQEEGDSLDYCPETDWVLDTSDSSRDIHLVIPEDGFEFLPSEYEEDTVLGLADGEEAFTVPWAVFADVDRLLKISSNYSVHKDEGGTVHLRIKRKGSYILVDSGSVRGHKWQPCAPCYYGDPNPDYLPVKLVNHF